MSKIVDFEQHPAETLVVDPGFQLASLDPQSTPGYSGNKADGTALLKELDGQLVLLQEKLFASGTIGAKKSLLLVLQAMDTAGKGGTVAHVMGAMNPQGVKLKAFKAPSAEEKSHDFLWRIEKEVPASGIVGVFDRSHYEDVLIHRVHGWADPEELERRYTAINAFEQRLTDAGTTIVKVMLHISCDEQRERLLARLDNPAKHWKYSDGDLHERGFWEDYMGAYQAAFAKTSTAAAPWHVVPANRKWYARIAVQNLVLKALGDMDLQWPEAQFNVAEQREAVAKS
ncbi:polyphosphate kinase 2 family protein [Pseudarthrobacter sp. PS3-L1]|uniref:polyphosphate kinase 2 family protein n=1 Tax=Pseudarthrobacter sp. PS3-L1 TaxID=3046207 RepID=UPI0024BAC9B4|nr:polyphosphate kinase 2 family protein [Pseudarthrobacter sp. PS3-L1]MDJ0321370.1 polyphosphate kinase 2 family protein [Pseudarthrobacter sp. PS3-L1]